MDKAFTVGRSKRRTTAALMATPSIAVTHVPAVELPVTSSQSRDGNRILQQASDLIAISPSAPHAICYGPLAAYFAFIALVASQSASGGDVRYWPHRSSITRAGWSDARASKTCWKKLVASIKLRVR